MKRILYIHPIAGVDHELEDYLQKVKGPDSELSMAALDRAPQHLEYYYYGALAQADLVHRALQAEREGYDAAILGCFYDPGLREAREVVQHTVIMAPAESSLHIASMLGHRFSILVGRRKWIPGMLENVIRYGLAPRLASFRPVGLGVLDFHRDPALTARRLEEEARRAVDEDGAEVIVLGCTMQYGFFRELQNKLGIPVIDPLVASVRMAELFVDLRDSFGWSPSKVGEYESPPLAEITSWGLPKTYGVEALWPS